MLTATLAFDRSERFKDEDGHLHVRVSNLSKATVNGYYGREIPDADKLGLKPDTIYQLLRDPEELEKAADTFNNLRILSKHMAVSADDPKEELVAGSTGTDAKFEAPYLVNSLVIWRAEDIAAVENGDKCELSSAYRYVADMTPGTYQGLQYHGIMRSIRANHVALVAAGRAGPDVMVHDSKEPMMPATPLFSRKALLVKGALAAILQPKLVPGARLALDAALIDVSRETWLDQKAKLLATVTALAKPKLAKDQSLDDLKLALDRMDDEEDGEAEDDEMEAMDESEREEEMEAREEEKDKSAEDRKKGMDARRKARDAKRAMDKEARDKAAKDAKRAKDRKRGKDAAPEEKEEEREEREAEDRKARDEKEAKDKKAMDAALADAEKRVMARMTAVAEARELVRPHIGTVPIAMDSAAGVLKLALDHYKVDVTGVDPSAYKAILSTIKPPGARPSGTMAMDASVSANVRTKFHNLGRIRLA
jgi:hypothetical protein